MPVATLTSKGQITLPKPVRTLLKLDTGDTVDFIIHADGTVVVRAGQFDVRDLRGCLRQPGGKPASLEAMDEALRTSRARRS
jgi:AbrB family looped-hinge helix DNA binding protein